MFYVRFDLSAMTPPNIVYVDVDDTLIRTFGARRIPLPKTIAHVKSLSAAGATMYCWSAGGAEYAREVATQLGIADLFAAFLPKPTLMIDDQECAEWKTCELIHPAEI
jgi:FMN phosphatase YigB (HAD superfamily)